MTVNNQLRSLGVRLLLSRDIAVAYAFYCLSKNHKKDVQEKTAYLENQLTPTEKIKAELVIKDFC